MNNQAIGAWDMSKPNATLDRAKTHERRISEINKTTLELILEACKNEKPARAFDLATTLTSAKSYEGAMRIAVSMKMPALAEKINQAKEAFMKAAEAKMYTAASSATTTTTTSSSTTSFSTGGLVGSIAPVSVTPVVSVKMENEAPKNSARMTSLVRPTKQDAADKKVKQEEPAPFVKVKKEPPTTPAPKSRIADLNVMDAEMEIDGDDMGSNEVMDAVDESLNAMFDDEDEEEKIQVEEKKPAKSHPMFSKKSATSAKDTNTSNGSEEKSALLQSSKSGNESVQKPATSTKKNPFAKSPAMTEKSSIVGKDLFGLISAVKKEDGGC
jgi:hypothetical protein